jgi:uncharacterized membrane protein
MSEKNNVLAAIGYLPALFWVPMFLTGDDEFAKFHGKQSMVLFIIAVVVTLAFGLLRLVTKWAQPIYVFLTFIEGALLVGYIVLMVWGAVKAGQGEWWRIPILGAYSDRMNV